MFSNPNKIQKCLAQETEFFSQQNTVRCCQTMTKKIHRSAILKKIVYCRIGKVARFQAAVLYFLIQETSANNIHIMLNKAELPMAMAVIAFYKKNYKLCCPTK